jgi:hypothetical protein
MDPSICFITLGTDDLDAARRFYIDGLGWPPLFEVPGEIVFVQVGYGLTLSIWTADKLDADAGSPPGTSSSAASAPITLSHNVGSAEEVDAVMAAAVAAGGTVGKEAGPAEFGGYHGVFADPSGFRWEVAHNPGWSVADDGTVRLVPVDS